MVTVTERWEDVELTACIRCAAAVPVAPVPGGVEIGGGRLCLGCFYKVFKGSRARAAEALAPQPDGDDDGGPAPAAPSARPVTLALVAAHAAPAWVELDPADEALLDHFEQVVAESRDPVPCDQCGKAASPAVLTDEGLTLCLACGEGPDAPPAARSAVRQWRFCQTARRLAAAHLARQMTAAGVA
jgi:hypothetical protein